jgi:hypothetical protein
LYVTFDRGARLITEPLKEALIKPDVNLATGATSSPDQQRTQGETIKIGV